MEKQRIITKYRLFKRLLILFCIFCSGCTSSLFAQIFNSKVAATLLIKPVDGQNLYTKTDIKFEVILPYASASLVQIKNPDYPDDVNFKTLRKSEYYEGEDGTKLEIWLSFDKKGTYKIPSIIVMYKSYSYSVKFAPVIIEDNPEYLSPRMVISFSNGKILYSDEADLSKIAFSAETGEKLNFTVNLQYALQLIQFDYQLPKDSIFSEKQRYEITALKNRDVKYSNELMPVASFEWTALCDGIMEMPKITLVASSYKGYKSEIRFPEYKIQFVKSAFEKKDSGNKESTIFESAFDFNAAETEAGKRNLVTDEICMNIAELRSKERNSTFDYFKNKKNRIEMEDFLFFDSSKKEFPVILVYVFAFFVIFSLLLLIICIHRKNSILIVLCSILMGLNIGMMSYCISKSTRTYGMCLGGILQSIPEEKSASKSEISGGSRVLVSEISGDWYYIEFGETAGWIKSDRVVLIK